MLESKALKQAHSKLCNCFSNAAIGQKQPIENHSLGRAKYNYTARRKRRGLRDLTPRVHQHQEFEFEYYEHLAYDPNIPGGWYVKEPQLT